MVLNPHVEWSELIIEKGKLDPLSLWRVGDRLISELLTPFTTIVNHRPARYLNMFTWIIDYLNKQNFSERKKFWERFHEMEVVFICAIQKHEKHNYSKFSGQIGAESASDYINYAKNGILGLSGKKISNGWDHNYKNPMYDFELVETDFGHSSGLRVTDRGKKLASAFQNSISKSQFLKEYVNAVDIPIKVIEDLALFSCPCLISNPKTELLKSEQKVTTESLLSFSEYKSGGEINSKLNEIIFSIRLILHFMSVLKKENLPFTLHTWRKVLSTSFSGANVYVAPEEYQDIFRKWEMYNLDSLYVFSLESGLNGFLQHLQKNDGIHGEELMNPHESFFNKEVSQVEFIGTLENIKSISEFFRLVSKQDPKHLYDLENQLIRDIKTTNAIGKIFYSFLLCLYSQSLYLAKRSDPNYRISLEFYLENSNLDGMELSLDQATNELASISMKEYFLEIFFKRWIINRQRYTRDKRQKDVAWFSYNSETKTYNWESNYKPSLYRAARSEILMTFLLNMDIVHHSSEGWYLRKS